METFKAESAADLHPIVGWVDLLQVGFGLTVPVALGPADMG